MLDMVGCTARRTRAPASHSADDILIRHLHVYRVINFISQLIKRLLQHLCLWNRPGESVQHIAVLTVILCYPVKENTHRQFIRHQKPLIHVLLRFHAKLCPVLDVQTEHVARGNMRNLIVLGNHLRLCSFSGAGCAQHYNLHFVFIPFPKHTDAR